MVLVGLAMLFAADENIRSICLGGAFGVLIGTTIFSFGVKAIVLKHAARASAKLTEPIADLSLPLS